MADDVTTQTEVAHQTVLGTKNFTATGVSAGTGNKANIDVKNGAVRGSTVPAIA